MKKILDLLSRYQIALILVMLALGFAVPDAFRPFAPHSTLFLQIIMFAAGLELDYGELFKELSDWKTIAVVNAAKLVLIPILVSVPLAIFAPDWALPFIIAASMPTGLTAHALVTLLGGRTPLALVAATTTSILAPFTIPVMLKLLLGNEVAIEAGTMTLQIAEAILMPLVLAWILQRLFSRRTILKADVPIRAASLASFALVVASITSASAISARNGGSSLASIGWSGLVVVVLMLVFWIGTAWLASALLSWRKPVDRATITFCLIYMNYTLGLWVADQFFREADIGPQLVAIVILIIALVPAFRPLFPKPKRTVVGPVCLLRPHV
jgi:predicted Na+-dependent transporter